ncbi:MotA/TolQ/ExbB proton channel family protein [Segatella bryantii]|uniref:MotA/TolQ/ExbB proton channel family protein n=1 Tax=Segatella bryantii TaxID=77095 RepID=UPI001EDA8451|nr:MotA/TolQ/ExbB proton channel family protein [Segatella bryantii]UKK72537.1 MotA/TolQ/ExbB proton channel family protein [Segatella bryantii]UKK75056.1 MotA/TolQ/ExbB proton channel family protein [Segatella bryantii]
MEIISDILYWISTGLLVPVIVILIIVFIRALLLIGSFFGQYLTIRKTSAHVRKALTDVTAETLDDVIAKLPKTDNVLVIAYIRKMISLRYNKAEVKRLLAEFEIDADKDLGLSKMLVKLGPMLGLMGTLIPMGPALAGLASGDIESMARNMQVAFATTVTGLVASAIGYVTQQVKQRWYLQDITNLEYLSEVISNS